MSNVASREQVPSFGEHIIYCSKFHSIICRIHSDGLEIIGRHFWTTNYTFFRCLSMAKHRIGNYSTLHLAN